MAYPEGVDKGLDAGAQMLAAISYLGILALVPLVINRRDPYVAFHARQGLILWIWEVLAVMGLAFPVVGPLFFYVSSLFCFLFSVVGLLSVLLGRAWKFPLVGLWADKL